MKISQLMTDIIRLAEYKFGTSNHINDCIGLSIYPSPHNTFQVSLSRPTQRTLDAGEVDLSYLNTIKTAEHSYAFYTEATTLLDALYQLHGKIENAVGWDQS